MVQKCKNCGVSIAKFPIKDNTGRFIWKNLFRMSLDSVILLMIVIALIVTYKIDTATCMEILEDPLGYCESTNACRILINEKVNCQFVDPAGVNIFDLNLTDTK